ncbi:MAG TPA: zinc ribbon domain-containing protein, partial [Planctomycetota bacterium]|nr:zinc ribbon domain-containing protein [Planctomycetota bacterium]
MTNVYCPNCEKACSEAAAVCPKCGHPLEAAAKRRWRWARSVAVVGSLAGVVIGAVAAGRHWDDLGDWLDGRAAAEAFRSAEEAVEGGGMKDPHREAIVREDFRAGRPFIATGRSSGARALTIALVEGLPNRTKEKWLRECLDAAG